MKYVSIRMTFLFYCMDVLQLIICILVLEQEKVELVEFPVDQKIWFLTILTLGYITPYYGS